MIKESQCRFCGATSSLAPYNFLGEMVLACEEPIDCMMRMSEQAEPVEDHRYMQERCGANRE